jgi:hypothetical protein
VIAGDGIKIGKEAKKMPGVKWLHQSSESNSKAEHITGHSIQVAALLLQGLNTYFAVPLEGQIHEGLRLNDEEKCIAYHPVIKGEVKKRGRPSKY